MNEWEFQFGDLVVDRATEFRGVVIGRAQYQYESDFSYFVAGKDNSGHPVSVWFAGPRLILARDFADL